MSDFVCLLSRAGVALGAHDRAPFGTLLEGGDSSFRWFASGPAAIAVQREDSPQASARHGPLTDPESGVAVALAGHCAPVASSPLARSRGNFEPAGHLLSVASAPATANAAVEGALANLCGSFCFLSYDPRRGALTIARDHLGGRKLYYYLDTRWFIAASEPSIIQRHGAVGRTVDERSVARFLGFRFAPDGRSFFREIRELPPAHCLEVTSRDERLRQFWRFRFDRAAWKRPREQVLQDFRSGVSAAVRADTAGIETGRVGLSLSAGLDSPVLAALAPERMPAFSWYFDKLSDCDERSGIEALAGHLGLRVEWLCGDGCYPLGEGFVGRFVHPNSPYVNAFAALKSALYERARDSGCSAMMVGDSGDVIYAAREYWLRDLLAGEGPVAFARAAATTARAAAGGDRDARTALRRLLPVRRFRSLFGGGQPVWLTRHARVLLPSAEFSPILPRGPRRYRYDLAIGARHSELESEEQRLFLQCGLRRCNPFWNWPLLQSALNLPAYWYHRDGRNKVLAREAMQGFLPESVTRAGRRGLLGSFFLHGIRLQQRQLQQLLLEAPRSDWQRYVDAGWLARQLAQLGSITFGHTILWRVICYELWRRRLAD